VAGAGVSDWLGHKIVDVGGSFLWSASSSGWLVGFSVQRLVLLSVPRCGSNMINAIFLEEELEAAQSKRRCAPHRQHRDQVRCRARLTFQSGCVV